MIRLNDSKLKLRIDMTEKINMPTASAMLR
jgi:hypothetical protein